MLKGLRINRVVFCSNCKVVKQLMAHEMLLSRITSVRVEQMDGGIFVVSSFTLNHPQEQEAVLGSSMCASWFFSVAPITLTMSGALTVCWIECTSMGIYTACPSLSLCLQIPVPSITPSSSRWSWDPEEERRRQEKWQKEQERLLQVDKGILV